MPKIVRITRGQLRRAVVNEVQEAMLRGVVRSVLTEERLHEASDADWNAWLNELYKVLDETGYGGLSDTPAFNNLSSENQAVEDAALDVIRRARDEGKSQQDVVDMLEDESTFWQGVDLDALTAEGDEDDDGLLGRPRGMQRGEDPECEDCSGSGDCSECSQDGTDTNTGEPCENCGGTHECPTCQGSGENDVYVDEGRLIEAPAKKPAVPRVKKPKAPPPLPTLDEAERVMSDTAYKKKGAMPAWHKLLAALTAEGVADDDMNLMVQYLTDARRPDSDEQKEGRDTSYYLEMALDELRGIYQSLGDEEDNGDDTGEDESAFEDERDYGVMITAVKEFAERNQLQFESPYTDPEEGEEFKALAFEGSPIGVEYAAFIEDGKLFYNSEDGPVEITPDELRTKTWEG